MVYVQTVDQAVIQALNLLRYAAGEKGITASMLSDLEEQLAIEIAKEITVEQRTPGFSATNAERITRLSNKIIASAQSLIDTTFNSLSDRITKSPLSEFVAQNTATSIEIVLGVDAINLPSQSYYDAVADNTLIFGSPVADWWNGQAQDLKDRFAAELRQGLLNGESTQQLISRIVGTNGEAGVMDTTRSQAASLVQSSVQAVANGARREVFEANPDIVQGIQQISTLDNRTTLTCIAYSDATWDLDFQPIMGNVLPYDGGVPRHWNCRSIEIPILIPPENLDLPPTPEGTRASMFGQVPASTTFDEFLSRQSEEFQNEVLGVGRADLWREGKITLRDLVNGQGRELTLEELRAQFDTQLYAASLQEIKLEDLPKDVLRDLELSIIPPTIGDYETIGMQQMSNAVDEVRAMGLTKFADYVEKDVPVIVGGLGNDGVLMAAINPQPDSAAYGQHFLLVNSDFYTGWLTGRGNVGYYAPLAQIAAVNTWEKTGILADAITTATHESAVHELGHIFDFYTNFEYSQKLAEIILEQEHPESWLRRTISKYAVTSKQEAFAEFFARIILGDSIPKQLQGLAKEVLANV